MKGQEDDEQKLEDQSDPEGKEQEDEEFYISDEEKDKGELLSFYSLQYLLPMMHLNYLFIRMCVLLVSIWDSTFRFRNKIHMLDVCSPRKCSKAFKERNEKTEEEG